MKDIVYSIIITTHNRVEDLKITLTKISHLIKREDVECLICDDGSSDDTFDFLKSFKLPITIIHNEVSRGLIFSRNRLLSQVKGKYAISIDDDLHFVSKHPLECIHEYFECNESCAVQSFRIYWNKKEPNEQHTTDVPEQVNGFAGGANAFRMKAWHTITDFPDWFVFYGEENFATFNLLKKGWQIHYQPNVLVNHRVDLTARKQNKDYVLRLRRSIRSGWYLYLMFYPIKTIPIKLLKSIYGHFTNKVFKGNFKALYAMILAFVDLITNHRRIKKYSNRLTFTEYKRFLSLPKVKIYWTPNE